MTVSKFNKGDRVYSHYFGIGIVGEVDLDSKPLMPICVRWSENAKYPGLYDYFSVKGQYYYDRDDDEKAITLLEGEPIVEEDKIKMDAINPSHYQVEGIPEAIEIMQGLMTKEQLEGFLWGNIIKYAYRYGRKGDKAETAGKIAWYATQLKELEEEKRK